MRARLVVAAAIATALHFPGVTATAAAVVVTVPATSNVWLAGMPDGSTVAEGDSAPAQSPVLVTGLTLAAGSMLRFSASGQTDHCDQGGRCGLAGPEGDYSEAYDSHWPGTENGIATLYAQIDSLVGVFLDAARPDLTSAPTFLDFRSLASRDFASLSPLLKQPFFIGDGFRNDGATTQAFIVPAGATRLFLGTMDAFGWYDNTGSLNVTVTQAPPRGAPEPSTLALLGLGLAGLAASRRRRQP